MSELYDAYTTSPLASNISTLIYIAIVLFADLPRAFFLQDEICSTGNKATYTQVVCEEA